METGREALVAIERQVARLKMWSPDELDRYARELAALSMAFPNPHGADVVCRDCSQRLLVTVRPVTRDSSSAHCNRSPKGHDPELV